MKKYLRRIGALLLSFIMVLSVCTSVFANATDPNKAIITVNGADNATLTYAQVIKADPTKETGWAFVNENVAKAYEDAFGVTSDQAAIKAMLPAGSVDTGKLGAAQAAAAAGLVEFKDMGNPQSVTEAGVYLIKATEEGYTYNIMAAYVGFGEVTREDGTVFYPSLEDALVNAKKTEIKIEKEVKDKDNVTTTGAVLEYTVTTHVPFIAPTDKDKTFFVYDELIGAEYTETATAKITLAGKDITSTHPISFNEANTGFSVDLSNLIDDANSKAGQEIVITYKVKVTSENDTITNTAKAGHEGGKEYGSTTINTFEGNITLTKYGESNTRLEGAEFEVRRGTDTEGTGDALTFTKLADGVYKYNPTSTETKIVTKADGTVKIQGLDVGTYWFKETKAPKGYSVNTEDASATLTVGESGVASAVLTNTASMTDTKVQPLPSTGGIGTYIFTITGVMIMAGVAGMFIIGRRKEHE